MSDATNPSEMDEDVTRRGKRKDEPEAPLPSPWRRVTIDVSADIADTVTGHLLEEGALGLETADDETRAVPGRAHVPTGRATLTATFSREPGLEARISAGLVELASYLPDAADLELSWTDLYPEDWNAIFRSQWKPFCLEHRIWIVPSWEAETFTPPADDAGAPIVLHLDPGMAFGTGTHETTQLCVEGIVEAGRIENLLDVGTGTGILCLTALKLGAVKAKGTDIDPVAVQAAIENAVRNGLGDRFTGSDADANSDGPVYDGVVANILANTLIELVAPITASVARGGKLWLSGVLDEQEAVVRECYVAAGFVHKGTAHKNGWVRIDLVRP